MNILWKGARGPSVQKLQARLNELGAGPVAMDGVYGQSTADAVAAFQRGRGVFADGMAGPQTLNALGLGDALPRPALPPAPQAGAPAAPAPAAPKGRTSPLRTRSTKSAASRRTRATPARPQATVFVSYSHEDEKWLEMLQVHIAPLERMGMVDLWDDTDIAPGTRWGEAIKQAIASARVAVLLLSAHFMASDYIATKELPPILAAAEGQGVLVLPVIISPCWLGPLQAFQAVNAPSEPLVDLRRGDRDRVWLKVVEAITEALNA